MHIVKIVDINKKQKRVIIDDVHSFVLYNAEIRKYKIAAEEDISEIKYREIIEEVLNKRCINRAMHLLERFTYTEFLMLRKLRQCGYPEECCMNALEYLKKYKYINDEKYAKDFVFYRLEKLNKKQLRFKLMEKGIPKDCIEEAIEEHDFDENIILLKELSKKKTAFKDPVERKKLIQKMLRKGFQYDNVVNALRMCSENDE